jgi:hypothetical protein
MINTQFKNHILMGAIAFALGSSMTWAATVEEVMESEEAVTVYRDTTDSTEAVATTYGSASSASGGWTTLRSSTYSCVPSSVSANSSSSGTCTIATLDSDTVVSIRYKEYGGSSVSGVTLNPNDNQVIYTHDVSNSTSGGNSSSDNDWDASCSSSSTLYISGLKLYAKYKHTYGQDNGHSTYCNTGFYVYTIKTGDLG